MKHMVKRTISLHSPRSEVQGKNWTEPHGKQLICTARSPWNEEKVREIAKLKKQGSKHWPKQGERLENFGSGKIIGLLQLWGKQECSWGVYCAVQKEKVWGHVTMVAKFLGEFTTLFTNTSSLVASRPRRFRMWRPLSKHAKFKNERWNTETVWRRCPFSDFSWGEGGLYTG